MNANEKANRFSEKYINLAEPRLGAKAIYATDDFFADKQRMLKSQPAEFIADKYDDNGKWMDGWESRRKRVEGYDYCIVRLGRAGIIKGVDIDTSHFLGNHPPAASIDGCYYPEGDPDDATQWSEILSSVSLAQDSHHLHDVLADEVVTHVRLNIYPDGGVARLRIYGLPQNDWSKVNAVDGELIDLVALEYGGRAIACSDQAFGSSMLNLNMPGRGINMGDGWETKRRRVPGNEWVIMALAQPGLLSAIEVDTAHYKGNFPDRVSVQAGFIQGGTTESTVTQSIFWETILPEQTLQMDKIHRFEKELLGGEPITHIRVNNIPDGGISRIRAFGRLTE